MKTPTFLISTSVLLLSALTASAAPPGGVGGGRGSGGGFSGGRPGDAFNHGDLGQPSQSSRPEGISGPPRVDDLLAKNSHLSSQIHDLTGMTAQAACAGFKDLGECVSAAHVSKNLGIPFQTLRAKVTGSDPSSLGKAIQDLKPDANAKAEARKAGRQAKADLRSAG